MAGGTHLVPSRHARRNPLLVDSCNTGERLTAACGHIKIGEGEHQIEVGGAKIRCYMTLLSVDCYTLNY